MITHDVRPFGFYQLLKQDVQCNIGNSWSKSSLSRPVHILIIRADGLYFPIWRVPAFWSGDTTSMAGEEEDDGIPERDSRVFNQFLLKVYNDVVPSSFVIEKRERASRRQSEYIDEIFLDELCIVNTTIKRRNVR